MFQNCLPSQFFIEAFVVVVYLKDIRHFLNDNMVWSFSQISIRYVLDTMYTTMHVFYKENFYKKMSLKNPKTLRKC